ncbi:PREDICTED: uncharacterized protein LOC105974534 [Erythranthe guttata]|uniref:uncharacterized protein LOC105974534 n=1 Tax=Erythranthe guttata TaxID=4155 RepID=UPI00064DD323|nr:PREDICTED: uncharacterized protein LOC105974534 [Erythranthe guttata]|eukprot:XP_012855103.1 PREDICTED: uncharacterized protein LOC105974534 [Erythranthe guttata]
MQLASIASRLDMMDTLVADVAALKATDNGATLPDFIPPATSKGKTKEFHSRSCEQGRSVQSEAEEEDADNSWWRRNPTHRPHTKMEFPRFDGGDPRGWILKAEKYFRYYQTPEEIKVDIAAMYLEGDALDLFSWLNNERTLVYWEELVKALQKNYGPAEFQNPDEHLCSIHQTGTIQEYRQEFAKRSARVSNWPDHCLLGVFLNGLREDLKADVRIHKPRTVYKAMSLALEFESKICSNRTNMAIDAKQVLFHS